LGDRIVTGAAKKMTFETLCQTVLRDYTRNRPKSLDRAEDAINHLKPFFGTVRALEIDTAMIDRYVDHRQEVDTAANGTIKYELTLLKRMFRLSKSVLGPGPEFPIIHVFNTRKGFFEEAEFQALLTAIDDDLKPVVEFAYLTGWRIRSEILPLQWSNVDFLAGEIRLEPGITKNDEGRTIPFSVLPELSGIMKLQREHTDRIEREEIIVVPWVFHRRGRQIKDYRKEWREAIEAAGIKKRIPHDFRRTAVRNFERAGVPRSVAMKLVGHKTENIYLRYAIVAKQDLADGVKRLAEYRATIKQEGREPDSE
jgi:integrase